MYWPDPDETRATCRRPGIYRFIIEGGGVYVGRFTRMSRPMKEYRRNVSKLLEGRPYRPGNPNGFRRIHVALHAAVLEGRAIRLEIVENAEPDRLNERERIWMDRIPLSERLNGRAKIQ